MRFLLNDYNAYSTMMVNIVKVLTLHTMKGHPFPPLALSTNPFTWKLFIQAYVSSGRLSFLLINSHRMYLVVCIPHLNTSDYI